MMKKTALLMVILFCVQFLWSQNTYKLDSTVLNSRVVKDSLDIPWEIVWGPDDHIWMTERFGRVSRLNPKTGKQEILLDMSSNVYERSEAGMLGLVLHPDFEKTPHVFVAYTYVSGSNINERLVRFNYTGSTLIAADTLIEGITGNNTHIGCRLIILPDNTLLMSTGDAQKQALPQDRNSVVGKVLRLNLDGSIPSDNPNPRSYVWSYGHRNAQGIWRAPNGIIYSSEHGPTTDDELNILSADRNYGWPTVAGFCDSPPENAFCTANNVYEPLAAWTPTIAPSDIIWYDHPSIPELKDKLLMTVLKDKSLIAFQFNSEGDSIINQSKYLKDDFGRLRDICISPEGKIYLATNGTSWSNNRPFTHSIVELSNDSFYAEDTNTSVQEINFAQFIKVGPNPISSGQSLFIDIPTGERGKLLLFDLVGKPVLSKEVSEKNFVEIDVSKGVYLWKIQLNDSGSKEGKLIIR